IEIVPLSLWTPAMRMRSIPDPPIPPKCTVVPGNARRLPTPDTPLTNKVMAHPTAPAKTGPNRALMAACHPGFRQNRGNSDPAGPLGPGPPHDAPHGVL